MKFEFSTTVRDDSLRVSLSGRLPEGSAGNQDVDTVLKAVKRAIAEHELKEAIVDCRMLQYTFGDSLGSIWLTLRRAGIDCEIIATGQTRLAIEQLMEVSIRVPVVEPDSAHVD